MLEHLRYYSLSSHSKALSRCSIEKSNRDSDYICTSWSASVCQSCLMVNSSHSFSRFKNMKKELVRKTIENLRNSSRPNNGESHQLPAYVPNCDAIPTVLSENEWFGKTPNTQYTWNLFFYPRDLRKDTVVDVMMRWDLIFFNCTK